MQQNNNNNRNPQQNGNDNQKLGMLGLGLLAVFVSTKEHAIKAWLYDHMMGLVFIGFLLVVCLALYIRYRFQKNNEAKIERAQGLKTMKPTTSRQNDYYVNRRGRLDD